MLENNDCAEDAAASQSFALLGRSTDKQHITLFKNLKIDI